MFVLRWAATAHLAASLAAATALPAQEHAGKHRHPPDSSHRMGDSAFRAMQDRGRKAMGVDQYTSAHRFEPLPDGGRIELQRQIEDSAGTRAIREHLREVAHAFARGDFRTPEFVHDGDVPGARTMAARREAIKYSVRDLPRGGEIRITTRDRDALAAIHEFLDFQRTEHGR